MIQQLNEFFELKLTPEQLNEATSVQGGPMIIKNVLLQRANAFNRNKRRYPREILEREMDKYTETMIKSNRALGELDHSDSNIVNLKNVCLNIKEAWWDGDDVRSNIEILDGPEFPAGRILAGLLRRKIPVGISSRGMGSVEEIDDEGHVEVQEDFSLLTYDAVSFESTQGAMMNPITEGLKSVSINKYQKLDEIIHDLICNNSSACSCMFEKKQ